VDSPPANWADRPAVTGAVRVTLLSPAAQEPPRRGAGGAVDRDERRAPLLSVEKLRRARTGFR
jgi:hypothetical protein